MWHAPSAYDPSSLARYSRSMTGVGHPQSVGCPSVVELCVDAALRIAESRSRGEDAERDGLQAQRVERSCELIRFFLRNSVVESMVCLESVDPQGRGCIRDSGELSVGERAPSHPIRLRIQEPILRLKRLWLRFD